MIYLSKRKEHIIILNKLKIDNINIYRMTHIVITTPMIIKTHTHTNRATVTGRLSDEDMAEFLISEKKTVKYISLFFLLMKAS